MVRSKALFVCSLLGIAMWVGLGYGLRVIMMLGDGFTSGMQPYQALVMLLPILYLIITMLCCLNSVKGVFFSLFRIFALICLVFFFSWRIQFRFVRHTIVVANFAICHRGTKVDKTDCRLKGNVPEIVEKRLVGRFIRRLWPKRQVWFDIG